MLLHYICTYKTDYKWLVTQRVLKSYRGKMSVIYMWSKRQAMFPLCSYQSVNRPMVTRALGHMMYIMYIMHPSE